MGQWDKNGVQCTPSLLPIDLMRVLHTRWGYLVTNHTFRFASRVANTHRHASHAVSLPSTFRTFETFCPTALLTLTAPLTPDSHECEVELSLVDRFVARHIDCTKIGLDLLESDTLRGA